MKTTVHISDPLLAEAQRLAASEGTTLKNLIAEGLHKVIAERESRPRFKLKSASFKGQGMQSGAENLSWAEIRDLTYKGRGS